MMDREHRSLSKKDMLESCEAAEGSDVTCSLPSPSLIDSQMNSPKGKEPEVHAPKTPSGGLDGKKTGIDSVASKDENRNNGQVECEIDINYFLANLIHQIAKSAATKTLTLKQVSKLVKCFSRQFPQSFSPRA